MRRGYGNVVPRTVLIAVLTGGMALPLAACDSAVRVPQEFPADQVPLQSTSLSAAERSGDAWNLTVDGQADQLDDALAKLEAAGFAVIGQSASDAGDTYSLASTDYAVRLGVSADGKNLTYGVVARDPSTKPAADDPAASDAPASTEESH